MFSRSTAANGFPFACQHRSACFLRSECRLTGQTKTGRIPTGRCSYLAAVRDSLAKMSTGDSCHHCACLLATFLSLLHILLPPTAVGPPSEDAPTTRRTAINSSRSTSTVDHGPLDGKGPAWTWMPTRCGRYETKQRKIPPLRFARLLLDSPRGARRPLSAYPRAFTALLTAPLHATGTSWAWR